MDEMKYNAFCQTIQASNLSSNPQSLVPHRLQPNSNQRSDMDMNDSTTARKLQKADREKLRRDRLNEHFTELGNVLDPDRPKNDKATIISDTIQLLKDLTSEVGKLKAEYDTLTEESRELTLEKNDLREEKASLKSDIDNLNAQYQHRPRATFPWAAMEHSVMMAPPSYQFPMPMTMPPGAIPMHPSMQAYHPFFGTQNPGVLPNPCSTFAPYMAAPTVMAEQQSIQYASPVNLGSRSCVSGRQHSRNKSSENSNVDKKEHSNDITTVLELKTPGSTEEEDISSEKRRPEKFSKKDKKVPNGSSSRVSSSSHSVQDSSSNTVVGGTNTAD